MAKRRFPPLGVYGIVFLNFFNDVDAVCTELFFYLMSLLILFGFITKITFVKK